MLVVLTFVGIRENKRIRDYKIVLEEKNSGKKLFLDITLDMSIQIKRILGSEHYKGIFDLFISISEKFGFRLKKTIIDINKQLSMLNLFDEFGNNFQLSTNLVDGIILSTYNDSDIYIDNSVLKKSKNSDTITYFSIDLAKYSLNELYNMLERAKYDDSFLEEAVRIRDEIKIRESKLSKPYDDGPDLIY